MKQEEKIAESYFKSLGYENIKFEPKGNRTPDFEINGKIAVEVRRLNQFHKGNPIEKVNYNLIPKIIKQINSFENTNHNKSAFVGIYYSRPIKFSKLIKNKIDSILVSHSSKMEKQENYIINDNLRIKIFPSSERLEFQFNFGSSLDINRGGFVLGNIYDSLKRIIPKKYELIRPYKSEYQYWWLALVDHIGNGLREYELEDLRESIDFDLKFDKIFIISNLNSKNGYEL